MKTVIEKNSEAYHLGIDNMDRTHDEFVDLVNRLANADTADFIRLFAALVSHTEMHFNLENTLMRESAFAASGEHTAEHTRVLTDLKRLNEQVKRGSVMLSRAFVAENIPEWFALHARTMDAALATHLKTREAAKAAV